MTAAAPPPDQMRREERTVAEKRRAVYRAKHLRRRGTLARKGRRVAASPQDRRLVRLVICGGLFVALVAVKLLFPQTVARLAQTAGELIGRDADFKEAFAAMGRAIGGEEPVGDSLHQAYTAVFGPDGALEAEPEQEPPPQPTGGTDAAEDSSGNGALTGPESGPGPEDGGPTELAAACPAETGSQAADIHKAQEAEAPPDVPPEGDGMVEREIDLDQPADDTVSTTASYVYTMPALPDNASLEQRSLGFDYASPVVAPLSSSFGWREHPVTGGQKFHYGVDLAADYGSDVGAFAAGTVYATGESSTLGKYVMLQHEGGYITLYGHLSQVSVTGGAVELGDKIGEVGDTGMVTGAHLHFELHSGELYLNPIFYVELG